MMEKGRQQGERKPSIFSKFYLGVDRLMSGSFPRLFGLCVAFFGVVFVIAWIVTWPCSKWTLGEAFIQLTNPGNPKGGTLLEWVSIVLMNLIGLFFLNGLVLTLFVNWVSNRKDRSVKGEARYNCIHESKYSVIIGGHKMVAKLAHSLMDRGDVEYVLIQTQRDPERLRKEIQAAIEDPKKNQNVIIYAGDRTSWHELEELHLERAKDVYIVGEPFRIDGASHDAINMQCWNLINDHITDVRKKKIPCHVMFEYQTTFSAFQVTDIKLAMSTTFRFIPFNPYEIWSQQVLVCKNKHDSLTYTPLDGWDGLTYNSKQRIHLVIVGMSKMGIALAIEAAHIAHYPNFNNKDVGHPRTLITFIDRNAKREMLFFMGRFKELFQLARWRYIKAPEDILPPRDDSWNIYDTIQQTEQRSNQLYPWYDPLKDEDYGSPYYGGYLGEALVDIDFEFIEGDVALPSVQKYIKDACADKSSNVECHNVDSLECTSKTTIAVCLPNAAEAMSAALYFAPSVYEDAQEILVQQAESGALVDAVRFGLTGEATSKYRVLKPFGMIDKCDYMTHINSILPKIVAYAYKCLPNTNLAVEYSKAVSMEAFVQTVEDNWINISQEGGKSTIAKRWSNLYCANSFDTKLRSIGMRKVEEECLKDETSIERLAQVEHNRWVMEQLLLGIRPVDQSYKDQIPIEDTAIRNMLKRNNIHPDMVSNEMLGSAIAYDMEIAKIIPLAMAIALVIEGKLQFQQ